MKVGFFQFDVQLCEKKKNTDKVFAELENVDFDLMVLPELFNSGYFFSSKDQLAHMAERIPCGKTTHLLMEIAERKNGYIVAGLAEIDDDRLYNTAVVVGPEGYVGKHRKVHLTRFETQFFSRGGKFEVFDLGGVKVGICICFDSWFPEAARLLVKKGAQILCHPSNFGGQNSLDILRIRALENMVYTITANRTGIEYGESFDAEFRGESRIIDVDGSIIITAGSSEALRIVDIDPELATRKSSVMCDDLLAEVSL